MAGMKRKSVAPERLRDMRLAAGLTQSEAAKGAGIHLATLSRLENKGAPLFTESALRTAEYLEACIAAMDRQEEECRQEEGHNGVPEYYAGRGGIQAVDLIDAFGLDFLLGNAVKYIIRAGKKPGNSRLDDLKKAQYYISRAVAKEQG